MAKPKKIIDTSEFVDSHGREPRGRGSWAFRPASNACTCATCATDWFWHKGTYAEARASVPAGVWVLLP